MSSLRLALKQSLAETGHLAIHDKTNRKHSSSRDPARRRKTNKRKASSSNKSKRKKQFTSLTEQNVKKESTSEISESFPTTIDTNGDTNLSGGVAASDDGNSISSDEGSSFSDSDTVTNASSCYSHRLNQRIYSSEDEDSSEEMHEDMKGVFDIDGTSADESHDLKASSNTMPMTQNFDSKQQQHSQSHGENLANQQQQSPRKKKKRKRKDKVKRKKDRIKQSFIKGEDQESLGYEDENDCQNERRLDGVDTQSFEPQVGSEVSSVANDVVIEPRSLHSRTSSLKMEACKQMATVKEPSSDVLDWVSGMSQGKQRRKIRVGMRVKVCFEFKGDEIDADGNNVRYYRWCGGGVTHVGLDGKEIRILYDDGTLEDTAFPDREIVVDDVGNGKHQVPADAFLPKQPALLIGGKEDHNEHDSDEKLVKSEGNDEEQERGQDNLSNNGCVGNSMEASHASVLKSVKVECMEEIGAGLMRGDSSNGVENSTSKISNESSSCHPSSTGNPEASEVGAQFKSDAETGGNAKEFLCSPSWGSNHSDKLNHQSGSESSPNQESASAAVETEDLSPARVSKKIKLKRRKLPSPNNSDNNRTMKSRDSTMENQGTKLDNSTPSLKIRLKTKSMKHKKRTDNPESTSPVMDDPDLTKIKIKCDPEENIAVESWPNDACTPNEVRTRKSRKASLYPQGENAWLGDDEGQGIKRSQSEMEEASEPENDAALMIKLSGKGASVTNSDNASSEAVGIDNCSTPVINFLFKGRKPTTEEKTNKKIASFKSMPASSEQILEATIEGLPKKKKMRAHSPGVTSHRPNSVRSPRQGKSNRAEGQTGNSTLQENQIASGKKKPKEKQPSFDPTTVRNHDSIKSTNKDTTKYSRANLSECKGVGTEFGTKLISEPLQSVARSGRKIGKISKQRTAGKDEPTMRDASSKSKRKNKSKNGMIQRSMKEVDREDNSEIENWVRCENCDKWRLIPSYVDVDGLPEHWYCKDNPDTSRNTCEAPEQTQEEVAREKKLKNAFDEKNISNRSKAQSPLTLHNKRSSKCMKVPISNRTTHGTVDDTDFDTIGSMDGTPHNDGADNIESTSSEFYNDHTSEVQITPDPPSGGEIDGTGSDGTVVSALPGNKNGKGSCRKNRKGKSDEKEKKGSKGKKQKEAVNQEWVQCEKCEKWRRLPPRIKAKDLPDVWTCDMNDWDPRSASCAVQEDHKVDKTINPGRDIIGKDGLNSGLQTNKLSYRNLIRIPNRTISERTRAADSLFSSCATDPDKPPTVLYANSSAFQHKGGINKSIEDDKETISLLEYMRNSELWKDLYHYTFQPSCITEKIETVSQGANAQADRHNIQSMKAMVYNALGTRKLAAHDVLLECQCREWDDSKFISLRSSCTLESVKSSLNELINDGLVKGLCSNSYLGDVKFDEVTYCRAHNMKDETNTLSTKASKQRSRCMKISKPWKKSGLDAGS